MNDLHQAMNFVQPIEVSDNDVWFRRGDLFRPFVNGLNGDKVRQTLALLLANADYIRSACDGTVATSCGVHANQGYVVAYVARALGFKSIVAVGGKSKELAIKQHELLRACSEIGCQIEVLARVGYPNVIASRLEQKYGNGRAFIVRFGLTMPEHQSTLLSATADQVREIPDDLENLVIPVGSGATAAGVLQGLVKYAKRPRNVILVQNAGFDRRSEIDELLGFHYPYKYVALDTYPYARWINVFVGAPGGAFQLDGINEAKAFEWMTKSIDGKKGKTLFWIVANSALFRPSRAQTKPSSDVID